jgi:cobalamin biosynthesis protein CobT
VDCIKELALLGYVVKIDDLGLFKGSVDANGLTLDKGAKITAGRGAQRSDEENGSTDSGNNGSTENGGGSNENGGENQGGGGSNDNGGQNQGGGTNTGGDGGDDEEGDEN